MVEKSEKCGCYSCCKIYDAKLVWEYVDDGETALCPMCYIDSVLPDACGVKLEKEMLESYRRSGFENKKK